MFRIGYEDIVNKIVKEKGVSRDEVETKINDKISQLSDLVSKEGAAQVIAAELGISFEDERLKIDELLQGMKKVNVIGQVLSLSPVRTFMRKGTEGKVVNLLIADETSNIKIVLWDMHHIDLIEKGEVGEGSVVEVLNGTMRDDEIHLGSFSELKLSNEKLENIKTERVVKEKNISDFRIADNISTRAFIVQAFEPRFFDVCTECKRKVNPEGDGFVCATHGKVMPEKRALINIVLDDGTETVRAVLFHDQLSDIGLTELEDTEKTIEQKQILIGKEMIFSGNIRKNRVFDNTEFVVEGAKEINLDTLIQSLEN